MTRISSSKGLNVAEKATFSSVINDLSFKTHATHGFHCLYTSLDISEHYDFQHNNLQHNNTQHNHTWHNDTQHNAI
jgi:hypothetical protein